MVQAGEKYIPYHADDGECKYYSTEDMNRIITVGTTFKTYHTTYFNSLKTFVNSLTDNEIVRSIEYGINIPDEYKSDVLRQLEQAVNGANGWDWIMWGNLHMKEIKSTLTRYRAFMCVKYCLLFLVGFFGYMIMELLFRGYTYFTMGVLGGITILLLDKLNSKISWVTKQLQ